MSDKQFPDNWRISEDYDPNQHMLSLKGKDYLTVQNRLLWFVRDQRELIMRGLATMPYIIRTDLVEHDRDAGYAQFRTYVRDVLGNEATMYGSETARDFGDYAEKASTKSLGRALLLLGYGTGMAPEMDEGERVVDSPVERRQPQRANNTLERPASPPARRDTPQTVPDTSAPSQATSQPSQIQTHKNAAKPATSDPDAPATAEQRERMRKYRDALEIADRAIASTDNALTVAQAEARICAYIEQWKQRQMKQATPAPAAPAPGTYDSRAGLGDLSALGNGGGRH